MAFTAIILAGAGGAVHTPDGLAHAFVISVNQIEPAAVPVELIDAATTSLPSGCGSGTWQRASDRFRFTETPFDTGCGELRWTLPVANSKAWFLGFDIAIEVEDAGDGMDELSVLGIVSDAINGTRYQRHVFAQPCREVDLAGASFDCPPRPNRLALAGPVPPDVMALQIRIEIYDGAHPGQCPGAANAPEGFENATCLGGTPRPVSDGHVVTVENPVIITNATQIPIAWQTHRGVEPAPDGQITFERQQGTILLDASHEAQYGNLTVTPITATFAGPIVASGDRTRPTITSPLGNQWTGTWVVGEDRNESEQLEVVAEWAENIFAIDGPGEYTIEFSSNRTFVPAPSVIQQVVNNTRLPETFVPLSVIVIPLVALGASAVLGTVDHRHFRATLVLPKPRQGLRVYSWLGFIGLFLAGVLLSLLYGWTTLREVPVATSGWTVYGLAGAAALGGIILIVAASSAWSRRRSNLHDAAERDLGAMTNRASELETVLAGATHDMKTPLIALDWLTKDLEKDLSEANEQAVAETLQRVRRTVDGLDGFVRELLDVIHVDSAGAMPKHKVSLLGVVDDVVQELADHAHKRRVSIHVGAAPELVVLSDDRRLHQVLRNLIGNAIKYGKPEDGTVRVTAAKTSDGGIRLSVEDDGPGIPEEARERVFKMFERNDATGQQEGSGIGLALVQRIMEKHGGSVTVGASGLGGARFELQFPAKRVATDDEL